MELNNGSLISADICETVATFNHKPLVLVAEAGLWSGIPLSALGIDGRVGAGVGIATAFETY